MMKMNSIHLNSKAGSAGGWAALSLALAAAGSCFGDGMSDVIDGFRQGGKVSLDARARYEHNEIGGTDIDGYSLRTRLGYTTGEYEGWQGMIELEDVSFLNDDDRPALDVPATELNQAWLSYENYKLGRQIYALDDHRFIGNVGWRQNIQTYDALTAAFLPNGDAKINLGYLDAVHRVNATSQDLMGIVANADYAFSDAFGVTGFAYLLDFDEPVLASSDTYGFRAVGELPADSVTYTYAFSYGRQFDNSGSASDEFDLHYIAGEVGATIGGFVFGGGVEILEGDGETGFTTPLATVHKFNGFADAFAANSVGLAGGLPQGLEDYYALIGFSIGEVPVKLYYHSFETENVSDFLGEEFDAVASYKLNEYVMLIAKYAKYETDGPETVSYGGVDRTLVSVEANLSF